MSDPTIAIGLCSSLLHHWQRYSSRCSASFNYVLDHCRLYHMEVNPRQDIWHEIFAKELGSCFCLAMNSKWNGWGPCWMLPYSEVPLSEQLDAQQSSLYSCRAIVLAEGWCFRRASGLPNLVSRNCRRSVWHCKDHAGFACRNFYRLLMVLETRMLYVEACSAGFEQVEISL